MRGGDLLDVIQENNFMGAKEATFSTSTYCLVPRYYVVFSVKYVDEVTDPTFYWFSFSIRFLAVPRSG